MKIIDRFKRATNPKARTVSADLKRLDDVHRGLADKAIDYVLEGRGETVLATLSNSCKGDELEVCKGYLMQNSPGWPRRQLLAQHDPFDVEFSRRYTEVLAAACPSLPDSAAGSDKAHNLVRVFFSEAFDGFKQHRNTWQPKPIKVSANGLTLNAAVEITKALGGEVVDLVDVLYNERGQYSPVSGELYRSAVSVRPLAETHSHDFIAAGHRIYATSRAMLVQDLNEFGLVEQPDYLDFVLELAGDSSKAVREMSGSVLSAVEPAVLESKAIRHLAKGNVTMRAGMVELLSKMGTDSAIDALKAHRETERTARVVSAIDTVLTVTSHSVAETDNHDDSTRYRAIDGSTVDIPAFAPIPDGEAPSFGDDDRKALTEVIEQENAHLKRHNEEMARMGQKYRAPMIKQRLAGQAVSLFNADKPPKGEVKQLLNAFLTWGPGSKWARSALSKTPQRKALCLAAAIAPTVRSALSSYVQGGPFTDLVREFVSGPNGDIRQLEAIEIEMGTEVWFGYGARRLSRPVQKGDLLRYVIEDDYSYLEPQFDNVPLEALWPYLAENMDVIDEAFGLKPQEGVKLSRVGGIRVLSRLPKPPARYFGPLLEAATGETKAGRAEARAMLADAPDVGKHGVTLLDASRQAIRAGAAEWIAERNDSEAIPALKARLKKEKSELPKAAILTALEALGEDLSGIVGPKALLGEAEAGLKKAKLDKLDWMALEHLPHARYRSNRPVPGDVLKWWIVLAVKLKQPEGNALFDIYLNRLKPEDAESFSTWILDSWHNYDTARPSESEGNAYAKQNAANRHKHMRQWYKDYTKERAYDDLKREFMSNYLNSGAATKGLLALAKHSSPAIAADRVRSYLKNHGARTSQASALLELLASMGDPVTLQVVISAATRLKQKGVQTFAGTLVEKVAEANQWTLDELADRTIPSAGLDEDGVLQLHCGPENKVYVATVNESLTLTIRNPDGKSIKSLPSGQDDATKGAKKQLSASRRELKQVVAMQSARLYESLCAERVWPLDDWKRDLSEHPIMRCMTERAVWFGLNDKGDIKGSFRPTAEGDFTGAGDEDVDIDHFDAVRLAYGAVMNEAEAQAWEKHIRDYEVSPLFTQFGRTLLSVDKATPTETTIVDRRGWVTDTFTIRGVAAKLGYERGEAMDGGYFNEYIKGFQSADILAVVEFSGNCLPEENVPAALISLSFERYTSGRRTGGTIKLADVPPVLLSECWNDYRTIVAKGAFDEQWEQKMPWT